MGCQSYRTLVGPRSRAGFTLIELLVVIAIVAILASLLLPCLAKAKSKARMIEEVSAGRQLMLAAQLYADDHYGDVFPGYVQDTNAVDDQGNRLTFPANTRYPWRLVPYLAGSMALIYSGENRVKLRELQASSHDAYVYSVSVFPSLGINSYFVGGNESEFPAATANAKFGSGTVVTKMHQVRRPSELMMFMSARSQTSGSRAQGYYQVTPPFATKRVWSENYDPGASPGRWGFVAPRFSDRAVAAHFDGHVEALDLMEMQDMRRWCNRATRADWTLQ